MPSSLEEVERFKQEVLRNLDLQVQLRSTKNKVDFLNLIMLLSRERGYQFSVSDVEAALAGARRTWLERWIG